MSTPRDDDPPLLPEQTLDDIDHTEDPHDPDDPDDLERFRRERPPHHGD